MQLIRMSGRWNREFPLLFAVFMSMPAIIISCIIVGESYPDGGGSCSFEEDLCGWDSTNNNFWHWYQSLGDNYMWCTRNSYSNTATFESPELCPTGNRLYSLSFQYSISHSTVKMSVYIKVNDTSILLWDTSNKLTGYNSKASEHIFINCSECGTKSFRIFFEGNISWRGEQVNIYSVSFHYNGSLQTLSICPTHSAILSTDLTTGLPKTAANATEMGLSGCGPVHFNNDNRLPPGAEAGIVIAIILLVAIFISVFVTFHRKGNSCQSALSCILKNPPSATNIASTDNQQRLGIGNSRYVRHEERLETVPTMPDQYYRKKDLCTKRSVDYELANSSTPFEYSNVLDDKQVKDEVAKMSQSVLPHTYRTIPKDSATYNNYCNTFHNNQEVISASSNTYNNLQSDCPRKTFSEANVYSLAENTVIYNNINHEENTIETSLNYADEYNKFQRNHEEDGHLASRKAEDTYNHLTNGSDERQQQFSE